MSRYYLVGIAVTIVVLLASILAYPSLPPSIATHWGMDGQPNGFSPKWALFLVGPGLMTGIMVLTYCLPWLSPKSFEVDSFRSTYLQVMLVVVSMLGYFFSAILWAGLGHRFNVSRAVIGGVCLLFVLLGNVMGKIRRNFYIGVRTPWALSNDRVWNATHRFAAKTFVVGGLLGLAVIAFGLAGWLAFVALTVGALVPVVYSLVFYKQLQRRGEL